MNIYTPNQYNDKIQSKLTKEQSLENRSGNELHKMSQYVRPRCDVSAKQTNLCAGTSVLNTKQRRFQENERQEASHNKVCQRETMQKKVLIANVINDGKDDDDCDDDNGDLSANFGMPMKDINQATSMSKNQLKNQNSSSCATARKIHRGLDQRPLNIRPQYSETLDSRKKAEAQLKKANYGSSLYANDPQVKNKGFKLVHSASIVDNCEEE